MSSLIKIHKVGPGWGWQFLGPGGTALCNGIELKPSPQRALENASSLLSHALGGPVTVPDCPRVGGTYALTRNITVWRAS